MPGILFAPKGLQSISPDSTIDHTLTVVDKPVFCVSPIVGGICPQSFSKGGRPWEDFSFNHTLVSLLKYRREYHKEL